MIEIDLSIVRPALTVQAQLAVPARGVTAVIGRSGAGKSTLLHAVAGLLRPARGRITLAGRALFDADRGIDVPPHRRDFGVVFQEGRLFPHLSVRHNLLYGAHLSRQRHGPAFDDVVQLLGIGALLGRRPHTLSGGERQRVAIGRALLCRPRALLMDEPLASLDPARRHELLGYLAELPHHFDLPVLYVTHQIDEVLRLADQVVVMSEGRTVAAGPALAILSDLSLQPLVGRFEAGSVLAGVVSEQLADWQLTRVDVAGQRITVPRLEAPVGAHVRLRVRSRDVALQREVLASSASNQLAGTVTRVLDRDGAYSAVELALRPGAHAGESLWALVTRRSVHALGLAPGQPVVASFKAVAVEGRSVAQFTETEADAG
ncbi:molybdenum ABC transporter ATP-binding protein [Piscinibacter sp.]|uniref:molybdenum ABC transporter ATP-binding protein n=1 Tax=Piscinibacter sp. TaxID=1903157 RepID=UPI002F3EF49A